MSTKFVRGTHLPTGQVTDLYDTDSPVRLLANMKEICGDWVQPSDWRVELLNYRCEVLESEYDWLSMHLQIHFRDIVPRRTSMAEPKYVHTDENGEIDLSGTFEPGTQLRVQVDDETGQILLTPLVLDTGKTMQEIYDEDPELQAAIAHARTLPTKPAERGQRGEDL